MNKISNSKKLLCYFENRDYYNRQERDIIRNELRKEIFLNENPFNNV